MLYLISYDLNKPEKDYPTLIDALERDGAVKILWSEWLVNRSEDATGVGGRYAAYMDSNDSLFVTEVTKNTAWMNVMNEPQVTPALRSPYVRTAA